MMFVYVCNPRAWREASIDSICDIYTLNYKKISKIHAAPFIFYMTLNLKVFKFNFRSKTKNYYVLSNLKHVSNRTFLEYRIWQIFIVRDRVSFELKYELLIRGDSPLFKINNDIKSFYNKRMTMIYFWKYPQMSAGKYVDIMIYRNNLWQDMICCLET